jgi:hypothetical protein
MANMCSVEFRLKFSSKEASAKFAENFTKEMTEAEAKNEGVRISQNTWLFDSVMERIGDNSISISGWVKWGLTHEAIREFVESLKKQGLESLECLYEETGNMIYGRYEYHDGELWDIYVPEDNPAWESDYEDESFYDRLEEALEDDGESLMVA